MAVPVTHVNDPNGPLFRYLADVADNKEQLDLETVKEKLRNQKNSTISNPYSDPLLLTIKTPNIPTEVADLLISDGFRIKEGHKLLEAAPVDRIKYALERFPDLQLAPPWSINALHYVIRYRPHPDKIPVIELLLKHGVNVNADPQGDLVITTAMKNLDKDTVEYLLAQKIQPVILNSTPQTPLRIPPLHAAQISFTHGRIEESQQKMIEIVKLLVDAGADVNGENKDARTTPLSLAIRYFYEQLALFLLEKGARPCHDGSDIKLACENKFPGLVKILLERGANPRRLFESKTLFHFAFEKSPSKDNEKLTLELLEILGQHGVDPNQSPTPGDTPLSLADNPEQFQLLLKYGAKLTHRVNNTNLIHLLLDKNNCVNLEYVLQQGVLSVNEKNAKGLRPLHVASQITRPDCKAVVLLLQHGAEIDAADDHGRTALVHAMITHSDAFETLLLNGANFLLTDRQDNTILHHFAKMKKDHVDTFVTLSKYMTKDQALQLLSRPNFEGKNPKEIVNDRIIHALFSLDPKVLAREGVDIFKCTKLFEGELEAITRGLVYQEFDSSHWNTLPDLFQEAPIFALPFESLHAILLMTPVKDIVAFSMTCRQFRLLTDGDTMWKTIRDREGFVKMSTFQNLKKEYVLQRHFYGNMVNGVFYVRYVSTDTSLAVSSENDSAEPILDCDLAARLLSVTNNAGQVALIDLAKVALTQDFWQSPSALKMNDSSKTKISTRVKNKITVVHARDERELYFRKFQEEQFRNLLSDCDDFDVDGPLLAYIYNYDGNSFCDILNMQTKSKVSRIGGKFNKVVLNGQVAALSDQNNVVELWDINSSQKVFASETQNPANHIMFKLGKFIISLGHVIEFIDCERRVSTSLPHSITDDVYAIDENNQILVTSDASCSNVLIWRPFQAHSEIIPKKLSRRRTPVPQSRAYPSSAGPYYKKDPSYLKLAATKDLVFFANDQPGHSISVYSVETTKCLYQIGLPARVTAMQVFEPYLIATLKNGSVAIINFNW